MAKTKVHAKAQKKPAPVGGEKRPEAPEVRAGPETAAPTRATSFLAPATGNERSTARAARILRFPEGSPGAAHRARLTTAMQGTVGNARIGRMLAARAGAGASPRLDVVDPEDRSEKEAEAVAGRVSAGRPAPPIAPLAEAGTRPLSRAEAEGPLPAGAEPKEQEKPLQAQVAAGEEKEPERRPEEEVTPVQAQRVQRQPEEKEKEQGPRRGAVPIIGRPNNRYEQEADSHVVQQSMHSALPYGSTLQARRRQSKQARISRKVKVEVYLKLNSKEYLDLSPRQRQRVIYYLVRYAPHPKRQSTKFAEVAKSTVWYAHLPRHIEIQQIFWRIKRIRKFTYSYGSLSTAKYKYHGTRMSHLKKISGDHKDSMITAVAARTCLGFFLDDMRKFLKKTKRKYRESQIRAIEGGLRKVLGKAKVAHSRRLLREFAAKIFDLGGPASPAGLLMICFLLGPKCKKPLIRDALRAIDKSYASYVGISLQAAQRINQLFWLSKSALLPAAVGTSLSVLGSITAIWKITSLRRAGTKMDELSGKLIGRSNTLNYAVRNPSKLRQNRPPNKFPSHSPYIRPLTYIGPTFRTGVVRPKMQQAHDQEKNRLWSEFLKIHPLKTRQNYAAAYMFSILKLSGEKDLFKGLLKLSRLKEERRRVFGR